MKPLVDEGLVTAASYDGAEVGGTRRAGHGAGCRFRGRRTAGPGRDHWSATPAVLPV